MATQHIHSPQALDCLWLLISMMIAQHVYRESTTGRVAVWCFFARPLMGAPGLSLETAFPAKSSHPATAQAGFSCETAKYGGFSRAPAGSCEMSPALMKTHLGYPGSSLCGTFRLKSRGTFRERSHPRSRECLGGPGRALR